MIWWLYTTPTDTLDVLFDESIEKLIDDLDVACQRVGSNQSIPVAERGWQSSALALHVYGALACSICRHMRGWEDEDRFPLFATPGQQLAKQGTKFEMPPWYEDEDLIKSHWSAAIRNKAVIPSYKVPHEEVDEFWPVLWPVLTDDGGYELHVSKKQREAMERDDLWLPDNIISRVVNL